MGSVEIPMSNITEAVLTLDNRVLSEAIEQLRSPGQFADTLNSSSAASRLIEALLKLYLQQFQRRVERFQDANFKVDTNGFRKVLPVDVRHGLVTIVHTENLLLDLPPLFVRLNGVRFILKLTYHLSELSLSGFANLPYQSLS